jgi:hypothetical protein
MYWPGKLGVYNSWWSLGIVWVDLGPGNFAVRMIKNRLARAHPFAVFIYTL